MVRGAEAIISTFGYLVYKSKASKTGAKNLREMYKGCEAGAKLSGNL